MRKIKNKKENKNEKKNERCKLKYLNKNKLTIIDIKSDFFNYKNSYSLFYNSL